MSLNILTSGDFSISTQLENKLNMAFSLICEEEKLSNCSVNLKILNNNEIQELNKGTERKIHPQMYYLLQMKIFQSQSQEIWVILQ